MKKTIWKFELKLTDMQPVEMPEGAEILSVQNQEGKISLWALVDPTAIKKIRTIEIFETGSDVYCDMGIQRKYISTFQMRSGLLIYHVFERYD